MSNERKVPVYIPRALYEKIEQQVKENKGQFKGVDDYVSQALTRVIREEEIARRLRTIGYPE
jgi:Arc/MetJ-type ribon-helix-helix transcriptional regulator